MDEQLVNRVQEDCEQAVDGPGKFENEERYVPYFYKEINGGSGECLASREVTVDCVYKVSVIEDDREFFPELDGIDEVFLHESNMGFVTELTEEEAEETVSVIKNILNR